MDERTAIRTLTKGLRKHFDSQIIKDDLHKKRLFDKSSYITQFSDPFIIYLGQYYREEREKYIYFLRYCNSKSLFEGDDEISYETFREAVEKEKGCNGANYFFVEKPILPDENKQHFSVTPYSIIGEEEVKNIRKTFYKDVHPDILSAMNVLGIENYIEFYKNYSSMDKEYCKKKGFDFFEICGLYYSFLNIEQKISNLNDDKIGVSGLEKLLGQSIDSINKTLVKFDRKLNTEKYRHGKNETIVVYKSDIQNVSTFLKRKLSSGMQEFPPLNLDLFDDFLNFVFELPSEDMNLDINKIIFKTNNCTLDYVGILAGEYFSGSLLFKEYFDCLDKERQRNVVNSLKGVSKRNTGLDSFLWSKGFKDIDLDYLKFYKKDAKEFIKYFKSKNVEEKKIILNDIYQCEFTNEEVTDWLDAKEPQLVKEVGLQNG